MKEEDLNNFLNDRSVTGSVTKSKALTRSSLAFCQQSSRSLSWEIFRVTRHPAGRPSTSLTGLLSACPGGSREKSEGPLLWCWYDQSFLFIFFIETGKLFSPIDQVSLRSNRIILSHLRQKKKKIKINEEFFFSRRYFLKFLIDLQVGPFFFFRYSMKWNVIENTNRARWINHWMLQGIKFLEKNRREKRECKTM